MADSPWQEPSQAELNQVPRRERPPSPQQSGSDNNAHQSGSDRGNGSGSRSGRRRQSRAQAPQSPSPPNQKGASLIDRGCDGKSGIPIGRRLDASPNNVRPTSWQAHSQAAPQWNPERHKENLLRQKAESKLSPPNPDAGHLAADESQTHVQAEERPGSQTGSDQHQGEHDRGSQDEAALPTTARRIPSGDLNRDVEQSQRIAQKDEDVESQDATKPNSDADIKPNAQGVETKPVQYDSPKPSKPIASFGLSHGAISDHRPSTAAPDGSDLPDYNSSDNGDEDSPSKTSRRTNAHDASTGSKVDWADEVEHNLSLSTTPTDQAGPSLSKDGRPSAPPKGFEAQINAPGFGAQAGARKNAGGMFATPGGMFGARQPNGPSPEAQARPQEKTAGLFGGQGGFFGNPQANRPGPGAQTRPQGNFGGPFGAPGDRVFRTPNKPSQRADGNRFASTQGQFSNTQRAHNNAPGGTSFGNQNATFGNQFTNNSRPQGGAFGQNFTAQGNGQGGAGSYPWPSAGGAQYGAFGSSYNNQTPGFGAPGGGFQERYPGYAGAQPSPFTDRFGNPTGGGYRGRKESFREQMRYQYEQQYGQSSTQSRGQTAGGHYPDGTPYGDMHYQRGGPRYNSDYWPGERSRRGSDVVSIKEEPEVEEPEDDEDDSQDRPHSQLAISYNADDRDDDDFHDNESDHYQQGTNRKEHEQEPYASEDKDFITPRPGQTKPGRQVLPPRQTRPVKPIGPSPWIPIILLVGLFVSFWGVFLTSTTPHGMVPISSSNPWPFAPNGSFENYLARKLGRIDDHEVRLQSLHSRVTAIERSTLKGPTPLPAPSSFEDLTKSYFSAFVQLTAYRELLLVRDGAQRRASAAIDSSYTHFLSSLANSTRCDRRAQSDYVGQWLNAYFQSRRRRDLTANDLSTHIGVSRFEHLCNTRLLLNYTLPALARGPAEQHPVRKTANRICTASTWDLFCAHPPEKVRRDYLLAFFDGWKRGFAKLLVRARNAQRDSHQHVIATLKVMNATGVLKHGVRLYTSPDFGVDEISGLLAGLGSASRSFVLATGMFTEEEHRSRTAFEVGLANELIEGKLLVELVAFLEKADQNLELLLRYLSDDAWGAQLAEFWTGKYEHQIDSLVRKTIDGEDDIGLGDKYNRFYAAYASYEDESMPKNEVASDGEEFVT